MKNYLAAIEIESGEEVIIAESKAKNPKGYFNQVIKQVSSFSDPDFKGPFRVIDEEEAEKICAA